MIVKEIFPDKKLDKTIADIEVKGISDDSRATIKGDIFFIMPRKNFDIFSVIKNIEREVVLFVADVAMRKKLQKYKLTIPVIFVNNIQNEFLRIVDLIYPIEANKLKIIGITGTNGKTTTSFCIYHILRSLGEPVSLIGTIGYHIDEYIEPATHTTPDFLRLRKILKKISDLGGKYVVIEVSSHSIDQNRIRGIPFSKCLFTNLSRDHLDYHKTMAAYFNSKKKLFTNNKDVSSFINIDDFYGKKMFKSLRKKVSYGMSKKADFRAYGINLSGKGTRFNLERNAIKYSVISSLCGEHNVYNILAAIAVCESYGFAMIRIIRAIESFKAVEGRLEQVASDIFVDYAHTPDALAKVLLNLKSIGYKKIVCVFGCGGDRDKGKRRQMGRIGSLNSSKVIITSDNPRSEKPLTICEQIAKGAVKKNCSIVVDRALAIAKAISFHKELAKKHKSCLLVAGKGHEDYQIIGEQRLPFKDAEVIRAVLKRIKD
jgi:UDP-N-acetylmuramoyl-L-alanyl-D-glutamate--2,6-diaminopimelate ligase